MSAESQDTRGIEAAVGKIELLEGFQHALDRQCRRFVEFARADWERLFAGKDPSDACVSVRIRTVVAKTRGVPACGFLKRRKKSRPLLRQKLASFPRHVEAQS
jgi:hypothetical protein